MPVGSSGRSGHNKKSRLDHSLHPTALRTRTCTVYSLYPRPDTVTVPPDPSNENSTSNSFGVITGVSLSPVPTCPYWFFPQHQTPPTAVTAHVWRPFAVIPVTSTDSAIATLNGTSTGVFLSPVPIWPSEFFPQHQTPPPAVTTHVCNSPAAISVTSSGPSGPSITTSNGTSTGVSLLPVPIWPSEFFPQHQAPPPATAHVWSRPAAISVTSSGPSGPSITTSNGTSTGVSLLPVPIWPPEFFPQHQTPPPAVTAHV